MAQQIDLHCSKKDVELTLKIVFIASKLQEATDHCTSIYSTVKVIGRNILNKTILRHGEKI
jgi:phosphate uptake regulator